MRILRLALLALLTASCYADFLVGVSACPTSGTKQVGTSTNVYQLTVLAPTTNTGTVYLGGPTVDTSGNTGIPLTAGVSYNASKPNAGINPGTLYFICTVTTDKIAWIANR